VIHKYQFCIKIAAGVSQFTDPEARRRANHQLRDFAAEHSEARKIMTFID